MSWSKCLLWGRRLAWQRQASIQIFPYGHLFLWFSEVSSSPFTFSTQTAHSPWFHTASFFGCAVHSVLPVWQGDKVFKSSSCVTCCSTLSPPALRCCVSVVVEASGRHFLMQLWGVCHAQDTLPSAWLSDPGGLCRITQWLKFQTASVMKEMCF